MFDYWLIRLTIVSTGDTSICLLKMSLKLNGCMSRLVISKAVCPKAICNSNGLAPFLRRLIAKLRVNLIYPKIGPVVMLDWGKKDIWSKKVMV